MNRLMRFVRLRLALSLWITLLISLGRGVDRLQSRLSNVRADSWHYRRVEKFHKYFGEEVPTSACLYWCVDLPISLITFAFFSIVGVAFGGALIWMLGDLAIWTYHHPLKFLLYVIIEIGGCAALLGFCVGVGMLSVRLKKHCPPLVVVKTEKE